MADQNITALPVSTTPETSDQLLLVGATEEKLIDYDKLADAILNKLTSKKFSLDQGTMPLISALNQLNSNLLRSAQINHPSDSDALKKLDMPSLIFNQGQALPYLFVFTDNRGDTDLTGGISVVHGFMYKNDDYGVQIAVHYGGVIRKRNKNNNIWSKWTIIHN